MTAQYHRWTSADDARLRDMCASSAGWKEVEKALGISWDACRRRAWRINAKMGKEKIGERMAAGVRASWTPERRAMQGALAREKQIWVGGRAVLAANPELTARRAEKIRAVRAKWWDWCPPEYREGYRAAMNVLGAKQARADYERIIARDRAAAEKATLDAERVRLAAVTPFQRMLERAQRGEVKLVDLDVVQPWRAPLRERDGVGA